MSQDLPFPGTTYGENGAARMPPFYIKDIDHELDDNIKNLLVKYSGLSENELGPHLHATREKAWNIAAWPCIGEWSYLTLHLPRHPAHDEIIEKAKSAEPGSYLVCDAGTGLGQELRALSAAGVPSANLRAFDLNEDLWNCGFDVFRDKGKMDDAIFAPGNILDLDQGGLASWKGTFDVLVAGYFLHCFGWDNMLIAATNLARLAKKKNGALIVGWQLGGPAVNFSARKNSELFMQNKETFTKLWNLVGEQTGDTWSLWMEEKPYSEVFHGSRPNWIPSYGTWIKFTVSRKPD